VIVSGNVADFTPTVQLELRSKVASEVGVPVAAVALTVASASVLLTFDLAVPAGMNPAAAASSLATQLADPTTASTFLSVSSLAISVQSIPSAPTVAMTSVSPSPPPSGPASAGMDIIPIAAGGGGGLLVLLIVFYCVWRKYQASKRLGAGKPPAARAKTTPAAVAEHADVERPKQKDTPQVLELPAEPSTAPLAKAPPAMAPPAMAPPAVRAQEPPLATAIDVAPAIAAAPADDDAAAIVQDISNRIKAMFSGERPAPQASTSAAADAAPAAATDSQASAAPPAETIPSPPVPAGDKTAKKDDELEV